MTKPPLTITASYLKQFDPCPRRFRAFTRAFPDGIRVTQANVAAFITTRLRWTDLDWVLEQAGGAEFDDYCERTREAYVKPPRVAAKKLAREFVRSWNKIRKASR